MSTRTASPTITIVTGNDSDPPDELVGVAVGALGAFATAA